MNPMGTSSEAEYCTFNGSSIEVPRHLSSAGSSKSTDASTAMPTPSTSLSGQGERSDERPDERPDFDDEPSGPLHIGGAGPSECTPITPFETIQYAHGGYAAAAPFFSADPKWMLILRHLMPEAHANLVSLLKDKNSFSQSTNSQIGRQISSTNSIYSESASTAMGSAATATAASPNPLLIIKWAENNPVVTAYGVIQAMKTNRNVNVNPQINKPSMPISKMYRVDQRELHQVILNRRKPQRHLENVYQPAIEWDVFLDPTLVKHVDGAMQYLENLTKTNMWSGGLVDEDVIAAANVEVDRQVSRLISRMILAHGSTAQLAMEATGVARSYNFSRVVRGGKVLGKKIAKKQKLFCASPTSGNDPYDVIESDKFMDSSKSRYVRSEGIFVDEWLKLFAKGLEMGMESERSLHSKIGLRSGLFMKKQSNKREDESKEENYNNSTKILDPIFCGLLLCLGLSEPLGSKGDHDDYVMAESARKVSSLIGENLRIVLDLKSRHVPERVWARLIDNLNSRGFFVDGIGSFNSDEVRNICNLVSSPINAIIFFHSAGDLQRACHDNKIKNGDSVYFNAGSLMWRKQGICEPASVNCCSGQAYRKSGRTPWIDYTLSESDNDLPMFQPFAYPKGGALDDSYISQDPNSILEDYQKRFNLNIGLYVQEFAIGPDEIDSLANLINTYPKLYTLGLAWGGINGFSLSNAEGDGYHSQRYVGSEWNYSLSISGDSAIESSPGCCASLMVD